MILSLIATLVKRVGLVCVLAVTGWHLVPHEPPTNGRAIVHIPEAGVVVAIDNRHFDVDTMSESPLICELKPGSHRVEIHHGKLVLGVQQFEIEPGKETVLRPFPRRDRSPRAAVAESQRESATANRVAVQLRKPAGVTW